MQKRPILIFGGHPDDVEIGMGGTARKLATNGRDVFICVATVPNQAALRKKEAAQAVKILGAEQVIFLPVPLKRFGINRETIGAIDKIITRHNPSAVFTHSLGDSHQDHLALTNSILSAARRNSFSVFMYEQIIPGGITPVPFHPHLFVDISASIDDKIKAIEAHKSQVKKYGENWTESVRGRAVMRGHQIGVKYAEAFEVVKIRENDGLLKRL
ncbi:MAG: PIG-L family deacetylase [Parcubacteria group bacterium]|nr:PIG-L family deacetylase [Parcubacteria group bacterium]